MVTVQAIKSCEHDLDKALAEFEAQRLPDVHALYDLDVTAISRAGTGPWGKWHPQYLVNRFQVGFWGGLHRALPRLFGQPEMEQIASRALPYRQVILLAIGG